MNFKRLSFLSVLTIVLCAAEESNHSIFEFLSKEVLFRKECLNTDNPHCEIVARILHLHYAHGATERYLNHHEEQLAQDYKRDSLNKKPTKSISVLGLKRQTPNPLYQAFLHKYFIEKDLRDQAFLNELDDSIRALVRQSADFENQSAYIQEAIIKRQFELIEISVANAHNSQIQE